MRWFVYLILGSLTFRSAEAVKACTGDYEVTADDCSKFNFATQNECINPTNGTTYYDLSGLPNVDTVDPRLIQIASMITNVFEGSSPEFSYAACEDIGDKRGYTCGYVGFTTATNDAESVVQEYARLRPNDNELIKYLARLHEISQYPHCDRDRRSSKRGLEGFCRSWRHEACQRDSEFNVLQRNWTQQFYMVPSVRYAVANEVHSLLGQAIFYDTIIQHGYQYVEPEINLVRILELTGPRGSDESEASYLSRFLTIRRQMQCCFPDNVWPASATRSLDLQDLVQDFDKYKDLQPPLTLHRFKKVISGNEDLSMDRKHCSKTYDSKASPTRRPQGDGTKQQGQKDESENQAHALKLHLAYYTLLMIGWLFWI